MPGLLQVSVIEGRNIKVPDQAPLFVRLNVGKVTQQTDPVEAAAAPKWLKFGVEGDRDVVKVDLVSENRKNVLGSTEIPVKRVMEVGTQVQWFKMDNAGEVCLVLRYTNKTNLSPTPSMGGGAPQRATGVTSPNLTRVPTGSMPGTRPGMPTASVTAKAAAPAPAKTPRTSARKVEEKKTRSKDTKASRGSSGSAKPKEKRSTSSGTQPVPFAILGLGALATFGAAILQTRRPKYYEVQEGDTLCTIGACFNRTTDDLYEQNQIIIADPNLIFPGDRLRIR
ncbi:LysM domain-containing protein [Pycnococcus provasolii]